MLFHYTDTNGVLGIVKPKEDTISLWFTYYKCLNDISEGAEFIRIYEEVCMEMHKALNLTDNEYDALSNIDFSDEKLTAYTDDDDVTHLKKIVNDYYICCFCQNKDSLNMWRYYSRGNTGYALEFLYEGLRKNTRIEKFSSKEERIGEFTWYNVEYDDSKKKQYMKDTILRIKKENPQLTLNSLKAHVLFEMWPYRFAFKHNCFSSEEEVRCVYSIPREKIEPSGKKQFTIRYRERNGLIIPYISIDFPLKTLISVILAPTASKDAEASLQQYLSGHKVKISRSKLPIRF